MTPFSAWIAFVIGGVIYHGSKALLGFEPTWGDFLTAAYWTGFAAVAVSFGLVKP